ncbi:hypothetical protein BDB01DRAFT_800697 [Pilobolus umbonatus]|nr:hypothetical protein BDB01DRAFT_800697 [Pilobolus umbonatus]
MKKLMTLFSVGVDIPDMYTDIYRHCHPHDGMIQVSLLKQLVTLSGLSTEAQDKILSLIVPGTQFIGYHEFCCYLALIALSQHHMDVSLETVYEHRHDLPVPSFTDLDSFYAHKESPIVHDDNEYLVWYHKEQKEMNDWIMNRDHISLVRSIEKEGFLFKHVNYEVESEKLGTKVLRRFSDFWWLWDVLMKRYPYRLIPNLPPKKVGGRNDMFEERRRRGLSRFINAVVRHPILGKDDIVCMFLSHPSELNCWKKANSYSLDEEFTRLALNIIDLERMIPLDLEDRITRIKKRLPVSIQQYEHMYLLMNQMSKLKRALGMDYVRYSKTLNAVSDSDKECWIQDCPGCQKMVHGYECFSRLIHQAGMMLGKQSNTTGDRIIEELRHQKDLFESFKGLVERREKIVLIPEDRLSTLIARNKKAEIESSVHEDSLEPTHQPLGLSLNQQREVHMKYCLISELSYLHKQQYYISTMYNRYVKDEGLHSKQWSDHWKNIEMMVMELPNTPAYFT